MSHPSPLATLTVAVLLVGGCGASTSTGAVSPGGTASPPTVAPTEAPTATTRAGPTATVRPAPNPSPTLSALAATYATIAAGGTAAVRECDREKAATNGTLEDDKAIARACRDGYVTYIAAMKAVAWGSTQPQAEAVISAAEACDALVVEMVNAPDWSTFSAAYKRLPAAEDRLVAKADAMRKALGLPPAG